MKNNLFKIGMLTTKVIWAAKLAKAKAFDYLPKASKPITKITLEKDCKFFFLNFFYMQMNF
jgi:hypothetical protein